MLFPMPMIRHRLTKLQLDVEDVPLHHVKPHGVLYGMIYRDKELCRAVYEAIPKGEQHDLEKSRPQQLSMMQASPSLG